MKTRTPNCAASGAEYLRRPTRALPLLAALPLALLGCLADDIDLDDDSSGLYTVSGQAAGVGGTTVTLTLSDDESIEVSEDGEFEFDTRIASGDDYEVSIDGAPDDRSCGLANNQGSMPSDDVTDVQLDCATLSVRPDIMQVHMEWIGPETVDVLFSTDPNCDWDSHSVCEDAGEVMGLSGHQATVAARDIDMPAHTPVYFVLQTPAVQTETVGARAGAAQVFALGGVRDYAADDDRIFLGGDFAGIGMGTPGGVTIDLSTTEPVGTLPQFTLGELDLPNIGLVWDTEPDGAGGWYMAGLFSEVNGETRPSVAHIRADGSVNADFEVPFDELATVVSIKLHDGKLYIAGEFEVLGTNQENLIAVDADTGDLDADFSPLVDSVVAAMEIVDDRLYVGGFFQEIDGDADFSRLAVFDLTTNGLDTSWQPEVDDFVWTIRADGDTLYVGGAFDEIDSEVVDSIAAFDLDSGELNTAWDAGVDGTVHALQPLNGKLYVGGEFSETSQGIERISLAAFDLDTGVLDNDWAPIALDNAEEPAEVQDLIHHDGQIYVAGNLVLTNDEVLVLGVAKFDANDGNVDSDWRPWVNWYDEFGETPVYHLAMHGNDLFIGGIFSSYMNGLDHFHFGLAAFDRETGVLDRDWFAYDASLSVETLAAANDRLYVGGGFESVSEGHLDLADLVYAAPPPGESREGLAAFDAASGEVDGWQTPGVDEALALYVYDGNLYAGLNDDDYNNLAAFDLETGLEAAGLDSAGVNGAVFDLLVHEGLVYVGGTFLTEEGGESRLRLAAFHISTGDLADWDPEVDGRVNALAYANDRIFVGGGFGEAAGDTRNNAAAFSAMNVSDPSLQGWDPDVNDPVRALVTDGDTVYMGGAFDEVGGQERVALVAVHAGNGALDGNWQPELAGEVDSLFLDDDLVHVGGELIGANGWPRSGMVSFEVSDGSVAGVPQDEFDQVMSGMATQTQSERSVELDTLRGPILREDTSREVGEASLLEVLLNSEH